MRGKSVQAMKGKLEKERNQSRKLKIYYKKECRVEYEG